MKKVRKLTNLLFSIGYFIFFIPLLVSVLSFSFNNSDFNNSYQVPSVQYEYETNEVSSVDDLVEGNIYKFEYTSTYSEDITSMAVYDDTTFDGSKYYIIKTIINNNASLNITSNYSSYDWQYLRIYFNFSTYNNTQSTSRLFLAYTLNDNGTLYSNGYATQNVDYTITFYIVINDLDINSYAINYMSASDYLGNASVIYNDSSLVDIALSNYTSSESTSNANMANFLDSVGEVTIFSWCTDVSSYLFGGVSSFAYYWVLWTLVYLELFLFMQFFIWLFELIQLLGNKFLQKGE